MSAVLLNPPGFGGSTREPRGSGLLASPYLRLGAERGGTTEQQAALHPPGLTDLLRSLDRAVFGALKAEYRAMYRDEVSQ